MSLSLYLSDLFCYEIFFLTPGLAAWSPARPRSIGEPQPPGWGRDSSPATKGVFHGFESHYDINQNLSIELWLMNKSEIHEEL
jgi:hypothetical protein